MTITLVRESIHTNEIAHLTGYSGTMRRLYRHDEAGALRVEMLSRPKSISLSVAVLRKANWVYLHTEDKHRPDGYDFAVDADALAELWFDLVIASESTDG